MPSSSIRRSSHAAGENRTDPAQGFERSVNLLQISSAFGETMESVDSVAILEKCWEGLTRKYDEEGLSEGLHAIVVASAEGYPFPTNLDRRPPAPGGMAPESEVDVVMKGLQEGWNVNEMVGHISTIKKDSRS